MKQIKIILQRLQNNNYLFSLVNKGFAILCGLISSSLLNRFLGPTLKGEYAFLLNIVNIFVVIGNLGIYQSYTYSKRKHMKNQINEYMNIFFTQTFIYFFICVLLLQSLSNKVYSLVIFLIPIQILSQQLSMLVLVEYIKFRQKVSLFITLFNTILTIIIFILCKRSLIYALIIILIKEVTTISIFIIKIGVLPRIFVFDKRESIKIIKFGIYSMLTALLIDMNYKVDIFLMKFFIDNTEIGLYSVGATLAEYAWLIPDAFKDVLFSKTARDDSINDIINCIKVSMLFSIIMFIGIIFFGSFIIKILYGIEFINSYTVTYLIFLGVPSMAFFKLIGPLFIAQGKQKFYFYVLSSSVILNIILNIILIPIFGKEGAAIASVFSYSLSGILFYINFIKQYKILWYEPLFINKYDIYKIKRIIRN
ncbi:polysaccharide biosynthesis C-terminal domain-containing protein [Defluviitalea raffinosedens]|uniref:oligosaccharide flippase family protein n=1 Tax=Defluviitalea raffinosedens TaxID=1450156 RepID=UPI00195AED52|nr:polysaccharide biosynthesis C-terminal domain-containing protein [Defluviitalea raffinosedens]MBM7685775.1 O-antigen/teichoic acid export membrane protein [Defluviitalea raffinosedens]